MDAYKTSAAAVGLQDVSPLYVSLGVVAASGVLLFACGCSAAGPAKKKASSGRGKKKSKSKATKSVAANGSSGAHKNGVGGAAGQSAAGGGAAPRGLAAKKPKGGVGAGGSGGGAAAPLPAGKAAAKPPKPMVAKAAQAKGKGKGKPVPEAPPVITVSAHFCDTCFGMLCFFVCVQCRLNLIVPIFGGFERVGFLRRQGIGRESLRPPSFGKMQERGTIFLFPVSWTRLSMPTMSFTVSGRTTKRVRPSCDGVESFLSQI